MSDKIAEIVFNSLANYKQSALGNDPDAELWIEAGRPKVYINEFEGCIPSFEDDKQDTYIVVYSEVGYGCLRLILNGQIYDTSGNEIVTDIITVTNNNYYLGGGIGIYMNINLVGDILEKTND